MSDRKVYGSGKCSKCGLPLAFYRLPSGKSCPCNPDGTDHWDLCKDTIRSAHLAALAQGKGGVYTRDSLEGSYEIVMETPGVKTRKIRIYSGMRKSKLKICPAPCGIPPWEECPTCQLNATKTP